MEASWKKEMVTISNRIEGVITFTLIRYVFSVLNQKASIQTIVVYSMWLLQFIAEVTFLKVTDSALLEILKIFKKLAILLVNQCIIAGSTPDTQISRMDSCLINFVQLTAILSFAFIISHVLQIPQYTDRGLTLLLYMYTDASNSILKSLNLEFAAVSVGLGVYVTLHMVGNTKRLTKLQVFFMRGLNMISINLILNALLTNPAVSNIHTTTMLSLFFLYLLAALEKLWAPISESKDYALWRSAQNLFELYSKYEHDFLVSMFLILLFIGIKIGSRKTVDMKYTIVLDLIALFLVNVLLEVVSDAIMSTQSSYQVLVMFVYVILIHYGTYCILLIT